MTDIKPLVEFNDKDLLPEHWEYVSNLRILDSLHPSTNSVSLILEDNEESSAVWVDETRAQLLVNALVKHFKLAPLSAEQLNADDARDEALAAQTDARLGH